MEKVLIKQNTILADSKISQAKEIAQDVNKVILPALEELGVEISMELIKDCLKDNGKKTIEVFLQNIEDDIKRFKTKFQKDRVRESASQEIVKFERLLGIALLSIRNIPLDVFDYSKNTGVFISEAGEEKLKESAKTYLTDPAEIKAYNDHVSAVEALNNLFKGRTPLWWHRLFQQDGNGFFKPDENVDYSIVAGTYEPITD
jgi:hypothetical protein